MFYQNRVWNILFINYFFKGKMPSREDCEKPKCKAAKRSRGQMWYLINNILEERIQEDLYVRNSLKNFTKEDEEKIPLWIRELLTKHSNGSECPICLCEYKQEDAKENLAVMTKCFHYLHKECAINYRKEKKKGEYDPIECPLCRRSSKVYIPFYQPKKDSE